MNTDKSGVSSEILTILEITVSESVIDAIPRNACISATGDHCANDSIMTSLQIADIDVDSVNFYADTVFNITVPQGVDGPAYIEKAIQTVKDAVNNLQQITKAQKRARRV